MKGGEFVLLKERKNNYKTNFGKIYNFSIFAQIVWEMLYVWWKWGAYETLNKWNIIINHQKLDMTNLSIVECDVKRKLGFLCGICVHGFCSLLVMRKTWIHF
jgi:hypothetical protein